MRRSVFAAIPILFVAAASLAEISGEHPVASPAYGSPWGERVGAASASDGHSFLVVWRDEYRNRGYGNMRVYATRVDAAGQVLDPLGIRIPTLTTNPTQFNVVYLGNAYLVCWNEGDGSSTTIPAPPLVGVRISAEGKLLDSTRVIVQYGRLSLGSVASSGSRTIIVSNSGGLTVTVLDRDGNIVDGPRALTNPAGSGNETAMTSSNGHGFLVVRTLANTTYATTLDANGTTLSSALAGTGTLWGTVSDLASDGDGYVAIFGVPGQMAAKHFGPNGEILETSAIPLQQVSRGFVFAGDSYLLMDGDPVQNSIGIRRLTRTGQPVGGYSPIASASNSGSTSSFTATMASGGSIALAGWVEQWGNRFNGSVIEVPSLAPSEPFLIARAATAQIAPDGASSGMNTAIVWNEDDGLYVGRLTLDGQLLDGRGIRVSPLSATQPRIVFDGENYIIGWREHTPTAPYTVILKVARFVPGSGALLDPGGIAITENSYELSLTPGANGTLLAWSEGKNVVATILSRDLSHGPAVTVNPSEMVGGGAISAAWNGSEWLLTWVKELPPPVPNNCDPPSSCLEYGDPCRPPVRRTGAARSDTDRRSWTRPPGTAGRSPHPTATGFLSPGRATHPTPTITVFSPKGFRGTARSLAQTNGVRLIAGQVKRHRLGWPPIRRRIHRDAQRVPHRALRHSYGRPGSARKPHAAGGRQPELES
ncbi:MAG TPA: hypothetical protein VN380_20185 [Thermoanaerobaculia bacterium]|jgi:hypothetical protein|nr:hypothetical protein [Thermoanaerobaculia bacterium]